MAALSGARRRARRAWRSARSAQRGRVDRWLLRALDRRSPGSVAVTEYPIDTRPRYGWNGPVHRGLDAVLAGGVDRYRAVLDDAARHLPALRSLPRRARADEGLPWWENRYFSSLDAVFLYSVLADRRPSRYVEVGSGHSTRFARRAIDDHGLGTRIVSIDPVPRAEVDSICDELQRCGLEQADLSVFEALEAGDVVYIDGSHVCTMGSDVVTAFLEVLPRIPDGVLVGVDDVFLPWDYPDTWADRFYGEQYVLAALLLERRPGWRVVFPGWYVGHHPGLEEAVAVFEDPARTELGLHGTTMWIERATS